MWAHARERIGARSPDSRYSARSEATAEPQAMRILADEGVAVTLASGLATGLVNARASTLGRVKLAKWELTSGRIEPFPLRWTPGLAARIFRESEKWVRHAAHLRRSTDRKSTRLNSSHLGISYA